MQKTILSVILILAAASCSGKWLDVPGGEMMFECAKDTSPTREKIRHQFGGGFMILGLQSICTQNKSNWTGGIRCESGQLQILCD